MGNIRFEVREQHLNAFPQEESFLKPFLNGFDVTWARRRKAYNTELSVYFLQPEPFMKETYGFSQEIMLIYSKYPTVEPRTIQAAESFLTDDPAKGRVEKLNWFLVSENANVQEWMNSYTSVNQESRIIISFYAEDLRKKVGDGWLIRNIINKQMYSRDIYDYRLPLEKDTYFFGRNDIVSTYFDAIKRSENKGLFGLRKTGKTSLLFKLERMFGAESFGIFLFYDCKLSHIRKLRWFELLERICGDISEKLGINVSGKYDEVYASDTFMKIIARATKPIVVVFDEIDYISPNAKEDIHWHKDFVDFWQTFWACQSRYRRISTVIAGVNPSSVEMDVVNGIQNPLFGIVSYQFLKGLGIDEMTRMVRTLGKRMGLQFDQNALQYLHERYGGHPLLTRIACSLTNTNVKISNEARPITISKERLVREEEARDADIAFYCRHVVSELKQFYPDEYEMLEFLASGQIADFIEMSVYKEYVNHLESYGLLAYDKFKMPYISIPAVSRYIGLELARREGRKTIYRVVNSDDRTTWAKKRVVTLLNDMRFLEKLIEKSGLPLLFGPNSFPEADSLIGIKPCNTEDDFDSFINTLNRCFVDSVENYGKSISKPKYFWNEIKTSYPGLWHALCRVKVYRHDHMHLKLDPKVNAQLLEYLDRDLEGKNPSQVPDLYFVLQQCVMDGLLTGIQIEINNLT